MGGKGTHYLVEFIFKIGETFHKPNQTHIRRSWKFLNLQMLCIPKLKALFIN